MADLPRQLATPTLAMLPRVIDQLSYIYVDKARIEQDDNGTAAVFTTAEHGPQRVYLPTASVAAVLLGPGVAITTRAVTQICRDGAVIAIVGSGGVRCYGALTHNDLTTRWLHAQATAWADERTRTDTARWLYTRRFSNPDTAKGKTIAQLRGMEGHRVKAAYRTHGQKHGLPFQRAYTAHGNDDYDSLDPINKALNAANQVLYGIVHATILALGASPALGFIHSGSQRSFVFDIADLYKLEVSVPLAFKYGRVGNPDSVVRRHFRDKHRALRLAPRIVNDIQGALTLGQAWDNELEPLGEEGVTRLWDPELGSVPARRNYADAASLPGNDQSTP